MNSVVASFGWMRAVFVMELKNVISYRVDFWLSFLGTLFSITGVSYFLWSSLYQPGASVGGFSFESMMLYYFLVPIVDTLVIGKESGFTGVSNDIYEGSLSKYLIYPIPYFVFKYQKKLSNSVICAFQYLIVIGLYLFLFSQFPSDAHVTPWSLAAGFFFALFSAITYFLMVSIAELVAFWADNVWSLSVALRFVTSLLGGLLIPLSLYPPALRELLYWTPFPYLAAFPIELAMGRVELSAVPSALLILAVWSVFLGVILKLIWRQGIRHYSGVGL